MKESLKVKVARIDERLEGLETCVEDIKHNDLRHINKELVSHKNWLIGVLVTMLFTLIGVIANLLI